MYWLAIATGVVTVILLQEKTRLESLATRVPSNELRTLVRFLVLTGVILPAVPNQSFTAFDINPFTIWLVVVAVSDSILLLTARGELIERLTGTDGVPAGMRRIGTDGTGGF